MSIPDLVTEFKVTFGIPFITNCLMTGLLHRPALDVIKFDKWLHEFKGYTEEEHGSIEDFIQLKYGSKAVKLIKKLI